MIGTLIERKVLRSTSTSTKGNGSFTVLSRCLAAREISVDHNVDFLAKVLQEIFEGWKIDHKVYGATTNNGKNMVNACVDHLKLVHMPYIGHTSISSEKITSVTS